MAKEAGNGDNGRYTKLTAYIAAASFCLTMLGGGAYVIGWLYNLDSNQKYQALRNAEIDKRIAETGELQIKMRTDLRGLERDLNEIETQFHSNDIIRNINLAHHQRVESLLWQKVFGIPFPTDNAYYPMISNRRQSK